MVSGNSHWNLLHEHFHLIFSEKMPDFISLISRVFGGIIFALVHGWQLTLAFMSFSPLVVLGFNLTIKVNIFRTSADVFMFNLYYQDY